MDSQQVTSQLKAHSLRLGFSLCGVAPAVAAPGEERFDAWLEAGYAGGMSYLADRREAYRHPDRLLDGARSVVMLALDYRTVEPVLPESGQARVARYAWGEADYHDVIRAKLHALADQLRDWVPGATTRGVVDTAPLLERDFAQMAGLGWIGKNTLLLNRDRGSWFFLAALLTDVELEYDEPMATDHCGTCTACLDVCPTEAFVEAGVLDASRCISYLTIEMKGLPQEELRSGMGSWLFGCDLCQEVCPWNRRAPRSEEPAWQPLATTNPIDLFALFALDDDTFRAQFRNTPLWRPRRRGILRNAAVVLGNTQPEGGEAPLGRALTDIEPIVRGAAVWALGQYRTATAEALLHEHELRETDDEVLAELGPFLRKPRENASDRLDDRQAECGD